MASQRDRQTDSKKKLIDSAYAIVLANSPVMIGLFAKLSPSAEGSDGGPAAAIMVAASAAVTTVALLLLARRSLYPDHGRVIPGPHKTALPHLSKAEYDRMEYKPDAFPGARDVETPVRLVLHMP